MEIHEIKDYLKKNKITYKQLATMTGLSVSTITKIFGGFAKYPRVDTIKSIEKALGINEKSPQDFPEGFMTFEEFKKLPYSEHDYLIGDITIEEFKSLTQDQQSLIIATIRTMINNLKK